MQSWFISDTHFGHNAIIKYCNRPFSSNEEMEAYIVRRWNTLVSKDDIVYHLGDFAFGSEDYIKELVSKLNGKIRLVMGNHDSKSINTYLKCGFDRVYDRPIIIDNYVILSHEPLFVNENCPFINIFGHMHNNPMYETYSSVGACVSVERTNYEPIRKEKVYDEILKLKGV